MDVFFNINLYEHHVRKLYSLAYTNWLEHDASIYAQRKVGEIKGAIRSRKSKKNRQYNDLKKKDRRTDNTMT